MKRKFTFIVSCCIFLLVISLVIFCSHFFISLVKNFSPNENLNLNEDQRIEQYQEIVELVANKTLPVKSNGCIVLPEKYKQLSDSGECFLVEFNDNTAIYFFSYRGILDASKGYLYITNQLCYSDYINTEKYVAKKDFTNIVQLQENLFSCSTQ